MQVGGRGILQEPALESLGSESSLEQDLYPRGSRYLTVQVLGPEIRCIYIYIYLYIYIYVCVYIYICMVFKPWFLEPPGTWTLSV